MESKDLRDVGEGWLCRLENPREMERLAAVRPSEQPRISLAIGYFRQAGGSEGLKGFQGSVQAWLSLCFSATLFQHTWRFPSYRRIGW